MTKVKLAWTLAWREKVEIKFQLNNMEATIISLQTTHVGNDNQHMTSLEIAEVTGKQHKHVMEAIRKMEPAWVQVAGSNFRLGSYKDANGQLRPCYILSQLMFDMAMKECLGTVQGYWSR